ncbi:MAG: Gfo/Idh/MocA family oxidoreductase [Muribaculaceae bacterium]|nr:Gfo/Idh/MocA family oxidoreductase [Muribaculaceae bacterium]
MKKVFALICAAAASLAATAADEIKVGIIGLDTSHSTAFTELLNDKESDDPYVRQFEIVAAYPYGSRTIESSYNRIPGYIEEVKKHGVTITESIAELLDMVDCVLLETNDGRIHFEQAEEVFRSGKPVYIDKPLGATIGQAIAICELAEEYGAPLFSSSALRFSPRNVELREGKFGPILGADCYSPHKVEPTHPDFGFYGIHGIETLYTLMGPGCVEVNRISSPGVADVVVGRWADGRIGTFRGIVDGPAIYGGTAFTPDGAVEAGGYAGYKVLLDQILDYLKTGNAPVSPQETLEIFAFMKASNMSRDQGGRIVTLEEAMAAGREEADNLLKEARKNR